MNLNKKISCVVTLDDYIVLSQDLDNLNKNENLSLNLSSFLSLKKIQSLEIEYFNKCDNAGAAFKLFDRILSHPPSKSWRLLAPQSIDLIQYWLDAVRKHLISHHMHWWSFLKQILRFLRKLQEKDDYLRNKLVEASAEAMFELAINGKLDVLQRYEILHTFNIVCAQSSKDIRCRLRDKFEICFIRLAALMSACGHLPTQLATVETLFRWLQERRGPEVRREAAAKWFRSYLYCAAAVDVFLTRSWIEFFQDARDFLNCHNEAGDLVFSAVCRKLSVGKTVVLSGRENYESWVDVNGGSRALSVVLDHSRLAGLGAPALASWAALHVPADIVSRITLHKSEAGEVCLSVAAVSPITLSPLGLVVDAAPRAALVLSARTDIRRLDRALRATFHDKYLALVDVENETSSAAHVEGTRRNNGSSEDGPRLSNPANENIRKPCAGDSTWSKRALNSPSSVSTRSLAQLHEKLENIPKYEFTIERNRVGVAPALPAVIERSEINSSECTSNPCWSGYKNFGAGLEAKKSQSDDEVQNKERTGGYVNKLNRSDPLENNRSTIKASGLFPATTDFRQIYGDSPIISSTLDKVINTDNLMELLVEEALESKSNRDSGIIKYGKKSQEQNDPENETIEDTQYTGAKDTKAKTLDGIENVSKTQYKKIVGKSASDESNTEAISDTPMSFVTVRKRNQKEKFLKKIDKIRSKKKITSNKTTPKSEPVSKMSTIPECTNESDENKTSNSDSKKTPLARRKRKLYSPKDVDIQFDKSKNDFFSSKPDLLPSDCDDDILLAEFNKNKVATPKSSCYREIEKERKKYIMSKTRKSKTIESPPSPKTKRLDDVFEKLKDNIEDHANDHIIIKNSEKDIAIYNFTSDSEDEDFIKKKIELQKRTSSTTIGSGTSIITTQRRRNTNKDDNKESNNETSILAKRNKFVRRKPSKAKPAKTAVTKIEHPTNLIDETIREMAPDTLDTSFIAKNINHKNKEPEPIIQPYELEVISDEDASIHVEDAKTKKRKIKNASKNAKVVNSKKRTKKQDEENQNTRRDKKWITKQKEKELNRDDQKDDERTISPLPCLVVEAEVTRNKFDDSVTTNLIQNFQKAYREGSDAHNDPNITQNMLSDNEKAVKSPRTNITNELDNIFVDNVDMENSIIDNTLISDQVSTSSVTESKKRKRLSLKRDKLDTKLSFISKTFKQDIKTPRENSEEHKVQNNSEKSKAKSNQTLVKVLGNYDKIICSDTDNVNTFTRSNAIQTRSRNKESKIIDLTEGEIIFGEDNDEISDTSIATVGITGHGDSSELPPSLTLLNTRFSPREIENLDPTIREYYIELRNKFINSKESSKDQRDDKNINKRKRAMHKVMEDGDSASNSQSIGQEADKLRRQDYEIKRLLPSEREESLNPSQECRKSISVSITRLSSKELSRWSASTKTTPQSSCKTKEKSKEVSLNPSEKYRKSLSVSISRLSSKDLSRWLPTAKTTPESSSVRTRKSKEIPRRINMSSESSCKITKKSTETLVHNQRSLRKSQISPIRYQSILNQLGNDESRLFGSRPKDVTVDTQDVEMVTKFGSIKQKYFSLRTGESDPTPMVEISLTSTPKAATQKSSTEFESQDVNRKSKENIETTIISKSRHSSNLEEWFRYKCNTTVHNTDAFEDVLQNIMEKLNTTFSEIDANTSQEMIKMIVIAQRKAEANKAERQREYQKLLTSIVSICESLEERNEQHTNEFVSWLERRNAEIRQRDVRQKEAVVELIKQDVATALCNLRARPR